MTLLSMARDAAAEVKTALPSAVAGSNEPDSAQWFRLANSIGKSLSLIHPWQIIREEQTFTAVTGSEQTAALPDDFGWFVPETFWDRTNNNMFVGPVAASQWQGFQASAVSGLKDTSFYFTTRKSKIYAWPDMSGGEQMAYEYASENWCKSEGGDEQSKFEQDTDVPILDEELMILGMVVAYLVANSLPAQAQFENFTKRRRELIKHEGGGKGIMAAADIFEGRRHFTGEPAIGGILRW